MFRTFKYGWYLTAFTALAGIIAVSVIDPATAVIVHWNSAGVADSTAPAYAAFFLIPASQVFVLLIFSALKYLEPRQENLKASIKAVKAMVLGVTAILILAQATIIASAFGMPIPGPKLTIAGVGLLVALIGNYFGKLKSSFFIGIRTPWTLSSEAVWQKTHRLGGRLFVLSGVLVVIAAPFVPIDALTLLILGTVLPAALISVIYSYLLWRKEQIRP